MEQGHITAHGGYAMRYLTRKRERMKGFAPWARDDGAAERIAAAIGALAGAAFQGLALPVRVAIGLAVMVPLTVMLRAVATRLGENRVTAYADRALGTVIGASATTFLLVAILWAALGRDPGAPAILGGYAVFIPVWWVILGWWRHSSSSWHEAE
jgi:O-antigen/teichoic acid export membrane protein